MQKKKRLKKTIQTLLVATVILLTIPISITKHYIINTNPRGIREKREEKINNKAIVTIKESVENTEPNVVENINDTYQPNISTQSNNSEVLGAQTDNNDISCKFKFVNNQKKDKRTTKEFCNIPDITNIYSEKYKYYFEQDIYLKANFTPAIYVQVDEYTCKKSIFNPISWFKCKEEYIKSDIIRVLPNMYNYIYIGGDTISTVQYDTNGKSFNMTSRYFKQVGDFLLYNVVYFRIYKFNISEKAVREYPFTPSERTDNIMVSNSNKPFIFPFTKIIGVTQWHGNTAFQKPHTGIDFGSYREDTIAVADGTVVAKGYDLYYGKCNSGGNYLTVKHDNGMHTTYFHLHESYVNQGQRVSKGELIAKTGNSGSWNCQTLAEHLHFETRLNRNQSSHVDPVKYISVNWEEVPTLGASKYPGRLSGDNPHPGR